jgi:hypothetical protein
MKLHEYFSGLLERAVNINRDRLDQLDAHERALTDSLGADLTFGPLLETVIRQGSWAHRTIIRPRGGREFDADLLVHMRRQRSWSGNPRLYPEALYEALLRSPRYRDKSELKTRCVRVTYAGDCHVDLVPYVRVPLLGLYDQRFIINRKENEFERVNPDGFADWVRQKDRIAHGHLRKSLRLLKYVRDYNGTFEVPSIILTVLAGSRVNEFLAFFERYCDLPTAFHSVITGTDRWLQGQSSVPLVRDPSCPSVNFGHRLDDASFSKFRTQFHGYADAVRAAYKAKDRKKSVELWRGIFGSAFDPTCGG